MTENDNENSRTDEIKKGSILANTKNSTMGVGLCFFVVFWQALDSVLLGIAMGVVFAVAIAQVQKDEGAEAEGTEAEGTEKEAEPDEETKD
ncbi:MAG: hypothetical protein RKH07_14165 [Gammaproteobacteria bacterium]